MAVILALGFFTADIIAIIILDKQKTIAVYSRMGRQTNPIEIINVNLALLLVGYFIYIKYFVFMPAIVCFIIFIILSTRVQSGMSAEGIYVGLTFIEWNKVKSYKIINDDISTFMIKLRANRRQYVFRCDKVKRSEIENILQLHNKKRMETI